MSTVKLNCRFCAQEKPYAEVIALTSQAHRQSLIEKLSCIGNDFVDFNNNLLPQSLCIACDETIRVSYDFFLNVKRAQVVLSEICGLEVPVEQDENYEAVKEELIVFEDDDSMQEVKPEEIPELITWASYPWRCTCGQVLESVSGLRQHSREEHGRCALFQCADCVEQFDEFYEFVLHVRGHRKVLRDFCEHCNIQTDEHHSSTHTHDHSCTSCGEIFDNQSSLHTHQKAYAIKTTAHLNYDLEIFNSDCRVITTWAEYPAICKYCKLKVIDQDVLGNHCVVAHRRCFGRQCVDCEESFDCFNLFVEHVVSHRPGLRTICPYCNIEIGVDHSKHKDTHTRNKHPCIVCGKIYASKRTLRVHECSVVSPLISPPKKRRKHPPTIEDLTCKTCGVLMKTPSTLKQHTETHAVRKRNYTCDRCGKAFYTKGSLVSHRITHENILKETCKICNKSFLNLSRLRKHVLTHNLDMRFQCDDCKRCFSSKCRLREHVKVHMDSMPYVCQYCPKRFRYKSIKKTHENQHTGAKPYSCDVCCMDFANWSNCNKHMKRKHGTLGKNVMTPHGKLAVNPKTGKPDQLFINNVVKEWSKLLMSRDKGKSKRRFKENSMAEQACPN